MLVSCVVATDSLCIVTSLSDLAFSRKEWSCAQLLCALEWTASAALSKHPVVTLTVPV